MPEPRTEWDEEGRSYTVTFSPPRLGPAPRPGRDHCIGCGRFLPSVAKYDWNQCPDCDTRTPEDY